MWSGPRNISTALMRSFASRTDTFITDEPFYGYYLHKTCKNHPIKNEIINKMSTNYNSIRKFLLGSIPNNKKIWYQKHMAQHILTNNNIEWTKHIMNIFLIRNPRDVVLSYIKKNKLNDIYQLGLPQQLKLFNFINNNKCLVIDSDDILKNPKKMLSQLCEQINIPFNQKMLSWKSGLHETDGIWAKYWYDDVMHTTGFEKKLKNNAQCPPKEYVSIIKKSMVFYNKLYKHRMRLS